MRIPAGVLNGCPPGRMMYAYLQAQAERALDRREAEYETLKTPQDVRAYQRRMQRAFLATLGPWPRLTDLGAEVVGRVARPGYRIEKIIYQSRPHHYVSALLYLPAGKGPHPVVLVAPGHTDNGKIGYQKQCVLLARNGLAAFCIDPIGQGERHQLMGPGGGVLSPPTWEHTVVSPGSLLVGGNVSAHMVWDTIRGVDYLCGRKEVDPARIGCTGNSGGGMMTAYMMAADDRIACAAPSCYITGYRRLLATIGPQDAEQNVPGLLAAGMDHADYFIIFAPKPALICCATRDFFDIDGTWRTFRQAKRIYTRLGVAHRVDLAETDWTHGFTENLRVGMVRWMRRWLLGADNEVVEGELKLLEPRRLLCTPAGETLRLPGARSVFDINRDIGRKLAAGRRAFWDRAGKAEAVAEIRKLSGIRRLGELPAPMISKLGSARRKGYRIEQLLIQPEAGIVLPALKYIPVRPRGRRVLYLPGEGISAAGRPGGPLEQLAKAGRLVLAADLRGLGATRSRVGRYNLGQFVGTDWQEATIGLLLSRTMLAMRAEDVLVLAGHLAGQTPGRRAKVDLVATGMAGPAALHAAALEERLFGAVELRRCLVAWSDVLEHPFTRDQLANIVRGALARYDLDDLARLIGGRLTVVEPIDATGRRLGGKAARAMAVRPPWTPSVQVFGPGFDG